MPSNLWRSRDEGAEVGEKATMTPLMESEAGILRVSLPISITKPDPFAGVTEVTSPWRAKAARMARVGMGLAGSARTKTASGGIVPLLVALCADWGLSLSLIRYR